MITKLAVITLLIAVLLPTGPGEILAQGGGIVITPENAGQVVELARLGLGEINDITIGPTGNMVALGGSAGVTLLNTVTGEFMPFLNGSNESVSVVAFSPDGLTLLSSSEGSVRLWDVVTGETLRALGSQSDPVKMVTNVAFAPDGRSVLTNRGCNDSFFFRRDAQHDEGLSLWGTATGELLQVFGDDMFWVADVAIAPDSQTVLAAYCIEGEYCGNWQSCSLGEIVLWDVETGKELQSFEVPAEMVKSVAFAPDGQDILVAGGTELDGEYLWAVWQGTTQTGTMKQVFSAQDPRVQDIDILPGGQSVLMSSDDSAPTLWDIKTGEIVQVFESVRDPMAYDQDSGEMISTCQHGICIWDVETGEIRQTFEYPTWWYVRGIEFVSDGQSLLSSVRLGSWQSSLLLWDINTGEIVRNFDQVWGPWSLSEDGERIFSTCRSGVCIWDVETGTVLETRDVGRAWDNSNRSVSVSSPAQTMALSLDGQIAVSACRDGLMRVWNVQTGQVLHAFKAPVDTVMSVALSPDNKIVVVGGRDKKPDDSRVGNLRFWDVETGETLQVIEGHTDWVTGVAYAPDGQTILSGSSYGILRMWDVTTGEALKVFESPCQAADGYCGVSGAAFSPDGHTVLAGYCIDGYWGDWWSCSRSAIGLWDVETGESLRIMEVPDDVTSVAFAPDGQAVLSGSKDGILRLWDVATGRMLRVFEDAGRGVRSVAFTPDGRTVLSGYDSWDNTVRVWDVATGEMLQVLESWKILGVLPEKDAVLSSSDYPKDRLLLWDIKTGEILWVLEGHPNNIVFAPDGQTILSVGGANNNAMRLMDVTTGETLQVFEGFDVPVAFAPDGQTVLSGSADHTLRLWDLETGETLLVFEDVSQVNEAVFAPDGQTILAKSSGYLYLLDAKSGETLQVFEGHTDSVTSIAFAPDGTRFASTSSDDTIRIWGIPSERSHE
jgi:WD40 repeat protein